MIPAFIYLTMKIWFRNDVIRFLVREVRFGDEKYEKVASSGPPGSSKVKWSKGQKSKGEVKFLKSEFFKFSFLTNKYNGKVLLISILIRTQSSSKLQNQGKFKQKTILFILRL